MAEIVKRLGDKRKEQELKESRNNSGLRESGKGLEKQTPCSPRRLLASLRQQEAGWLAGTTNPSSPRDSDPLTPTAQRLLGAGCGGQDVADQEKKA